MEQKTKPNANSQSRATRTVLILAECGILIGMSQVLSYIKVWDMPFGGSITALSMLPICIIGYKHGTKWGLTAGVAYGLLQLIFQTNYLVGLSLFSVFIAMFFDYLLAFGSMGLSGAFAKKKNGFAMGTALAVFSRFVCHFIVGAVVWSAFAEKVTVDGMNPVVYSLIYNGTYMLPELVITTIGAVLLSKTVLHKMIQPKQA